MRSPAGCVVLIAAGLVACSGTRPPDAPPMSRSAADGQAVATSLGTPFHALFKVTACIVSAVVAVPSAASLALTDRPERVEEQAALYDGLGRNCYGPSALEPI